MSTAADLRRPLGVDVLTAARQRIAWALDHCERACVSFSGGKDSTVMMHLVMDEARQRGRKVGVLFVDLEGQYRLTIEHIERCLDLYADSIDEHWVALPINLRNAVSVYEPQWLCWDPAKRDSWVRRPPKRAITDEAHYPFFRRGMEFEEFVPAFCEWYAQGTTLASFVGIRTQESLNRWRTISSDSKRRFRGKSWTTLRGDVASVYPIYDWRTEDIWTYHARNPDRPWNGLYDLMHRAGLTIHQQRICQPYGDDQRKGLWLFHVIEPETWGRIVARVNGANQGALYARERGNILGQQKVTRPEGMTWKEFAELLLDSMPERTAEHYRNKIAKFIHWWGRNGYGVGSGYIPDEADPRDEAARRAPSWRRVCKALLRNDYWCKGLGFMQTSQESYPRYTAIMRDWRAKWQVLDVDAPDNPSLAQLAYIAALTGGNDPEDGLSVITKMLGVRRERVTRRHATRAIDLIRSRRTSG